MGKYHLIILKILWAGKLMMAAATSQAQQQPVALLHRAHHAITSVMVHDIFSPPVASRIYLYTSLAAYEVASIGQPGMTSFSNAVSTFRPPKAPTTNAIQIDACYSAIYAMLATARRMVFSDSLMLDSMQAILNAYPPLNSITKQHSQHWAQTVSDSVMAWASGDQYAQTRKMRRYSHGRQPDNWLPTPPGYFAAVEPHWGKMRTVVISPLNLFAPPPPMSFGTDTSSAFYQQAYRVYSTSKSMTAEQKAIASFWDCNPFHLTTQGHLNFATKKLSPGGHWMSIAAIACNKTNANLFTATKAYLWTAIALYDGFISCWDEKFRSNLIRPETFINAHIDEAWRPLLQTPPFPEYTSGHSVITAATPAAPTVIFRDTFVFMDHTETPYGLPIRQFTSFRQAAEEAGLSRFYGGIHYMEAIVNGNLQGKRIGQAVVNALKTHEHRTVNTNN